MPTCHTRTGTCADLGTRCLTDLRLKNLVLTEMHQHMPLLKAWPSPKLKILELFGGCKEELPSQESSLSQGSICDIFYRGIQASTTIQNLYLDQSLTEDLGNSWRDVLLGVTSIDIAIKKGHGHAEALSEVLSNATLLKKLNIALREVVEPDDMTILAHGLFRNTSITALCLMSTFCLLRD